MSAPDPPRTIPIALTIAGSDSGGGAGIQADLRTFHQFGVHGTTALVAVTAQNTQGVRAVHPVPVPIVEAQLAALAEDLPPAAVKSGMLATANIATSVAQALDRFGWDHYVLDPVMVASSGARLLDADAEAVIRAGLVPRAILVTPNLDEAAILVGHPVHDEASMRAAGTRLVGLGCGAALIKGGHLTTDDLIDVLVTPDGTQVFHHPRLATRATHGTGCTLSAAITAVLARGATLDAAVATALDYLQRAMAAAPGLGAGHGPVWHNVPAGDGITTP